MRTDAVKYTYDKPRFISSPQLDYSVQPETYRRYTNNILGFYFVFILVFSFALNLIINQLLGILFNSSFSIVKTFMFLIGKEDEENRILYVIALMIFFLIIYLPVKKIVFIFTKPINRVVIEDGLYLIKGKNVFNDLENAFREMNKQ